MDVALLGAHRFHLGSFAPLRHCAIAPSLLLQCANHLKKKRLLPRICNKDVKDLGLR